MALIWRFIAKSWLSHGSISVLSTARGGRFPIAAGPMTCRGNRRKPGEMAVRRQATRRPNVELEVTNDAHQEHATGVGGRNNRCRKRAGCRSSDPEGGAGRIRQGL